jgi:hypothetical protein
MMVGTPRTPFVVFLERLDEHVSAILKDPFVALVVDHGRGQHRDPRVTVVVVVPPKEIETE